MKTQALSYHPFRLEPQQAKKRHGTQITANTVNHVGSVFAEPQPSPTSPPEPIKHSSMPAHAFWTANAVVNPSTGTALEYPQLKLGEESKLGLEDASREIGRLAQGKQPDMPTGSNTMHFINHRNLLAGCRATYLRIVAAIKSPLAAIASTTRAGLALLPPTWRLSKFSNIYFFYLGTPMDCYEYMRIPVKDIPANIMHLALSNYTPAVKHTPGLFRHATRPVAFSLVVDNFDIKYVDRVHAEHLLSTLQSLYNITTEDWTGQCIVESRSNGTTSPALSTAPCLATSKKTLKLTLTNVPNVPSMICTRGPPLRMAPKSSSPHWLSNPNHSTPAV
jgi:hypothetical protein